MNTAWVESLRKPPVMATALGQFALDCHHGDSLIARTSFVSRLQSSTAFIVQIDFHASDYNHAPSFLPRMVTPSLTGRTKERVLDDLTVARLFRCAYISLRDDVIYCEILPILALFQ
jgi:hypothetical protein